MVDGHGTKKRQRDIGPRARRKTPTASKRRDRAILSDFSDSIIPLVRDKQIARGIGYDRGGIAEHRPSAFPVKVPVKTGPGERLDDDVVCVVVLGQGAPAARRR